MSAPSENMPIAANVVRSKPLLLRHLPYFIGAAILVVLAAKMQFDGYILNILMQATTFAIAVFGLSVVLGLCGQINLAQAAFFGFGAYGYAVLSSGTTHWAAIVSIPVVFGAAAIFGAIVGLVSLRVSGDYLAIVTLFVGQAFMEVVNNVDTGKLGGVNGLFGLDPVHSFGAQITTPKGYFYFALVVLAVLMGLLHLLDQSRTGRAWRAVREDELAAEAMTIPTGALKIMSIGFAAAVGAIAGTVFAASSLAIAVPATAR